MATTCDAHRTHHITMDRRTVVYICMLLVIAVYSVTKLLDVVNDRHTINLATNTYANALPAPEIVDDDSMCIGGELWEYHKEGDKLIMTKDPDSKMCP